MNIDIRWDTKNPETLICEFHGNWTWHECREAMQTMTYYQENTPFSADYVFDLSESSLSPRTCLTQLKKLLNMDMQPPPGQIVVVDQFHRSRMMETMLSSVSHALGIQFVDSLKQARRALEELDH
jgi:uncharacterized membrane protein